MLAPLELLDLLADGTGFLLRIPGSVDLHLDVVRIGAVGEQRLAKTTLIIGDQMGGGAKDMFSRAIVALELDDLGAGEILFKAQDIVDLRAAPAVDRLIIVADA